MRLYAETTTAGTAAYQYRQLLRVCEPAYVRQFRWMLRQSSDSQFLRMGGPASPAAGSRKYTKRLLK